MGDGVQRSRWEGTQHPELGSQEQGRGGVKPIASVSRREAPWPASPPTPVLERRWEPLRTRPSPRRPPRGCALTTAEGRPPGARGAGLCGGSLGASPTLTRCASTEHCRKPGPPWGPPKWVPREEAERCSAGAHEGRGPPRGSRAQALPLPGGARPRRRGPQGPACVGTGDPPPEGPGSSGTLHPGGPGVRSRRRGAWGTTRCPLRAGVGAWSRQRPRFDRAWCVTLARRVFARGVVCGQWLLRTARRTWCGAEWGSPWRLGLLSGLRVRALDPRSSECPPPPPSRCSVCKDITGGDSECP